MPASATKVSAIVLAAGSSTRMGEVNKLLLPYRDSNLLLHCLSQIKEAKPFEIIVVTGHQQTRIEAILPQDDSLKTIFNAAYTSGMTSSIQTGIRAASEEAAAYMICLADMPYLAPETYSTLMMEFEKQQEDEPVILCASYDAQRGNPVLFSQHFREAILKHDAPNGCKAIIEANPNATILIEQGNVQGRQDIDYVHDYQKLLDEGD